MSRLTLRSVVEISPIAPPAARTAREISGAISSPVDAPGSTTTSFSFRGAAADEPCDAAEPPLPMRCLALAFPMQLPSGRSGGGAFGFVVDPRRAGVKSLVES